VANIVIGLDLGSDAVKAAVVRSSGRRIELLGVHHRRLVVEHPDEEQDLLVPIEDPLEDLRADALEGVRPKTSSDLLEALASSDMLRAIGVSNDEQPTAKPEESEEKEEEEEEVVEVEEEEIIEEEPPGPLSAATIVAISDLLRAIDESRAQIVVAVPGERISTWIVELPFADERTVAKVLPGELATQVPFAMDEMVLDWRTVDAAADGSRVLAAQVPKEDVRDLLEALVKLEVDPRHVCIDSFVLGHLAAHLPDVREDECVAIADLGRRRTLVNVGRGGKTLMVRAIDHGADEVTEALQEMQDLSFDTVEENKRLGVRVDDVTGTGKAVASAIDPLIASMRGTLVSFEATGAGEISRVFLCGGGARVEGLAARIEEDLGVPTQHLPRSSILGASDADVPPEFSLSLALALSGVPSSGIAALDLRRGEFAYRRDTRRRQAIALVAVAAVLLYGLFSVVTFSLDRRGMLAEAKVTEDQISELVREAVPDVPPDRLESPDVAMALLTEAVERLDLHSPVFDSFGDTAPLVLLRKLSDSVPKNIKVDVDEFSVNEEALRLKCRTDSFEDADQLMGIVQRVEEFAHAEKSGQTRSTRDGTTRFTITIPFETQEGI
jgi:type IV pilus assembly protein PilM